jgi:tetratricopeptide (TPR) repeat protein
MKEALPLGTMVEVHTYARQLIAQKRYKEALEVFTFNSNKHPGDFMTIMGMARGLSANGDYKKALEYMKKAEPLAPDKPNKDNIARMEPLLQQGKDIN